LATSPHIIRAQTPVDLRALLRKSTAKTARSGARSLSLLPLFTTFFPAHQPLSKKGGNGGCKNTLPRHPSGDLASPDVLVGLPCWAGFAIKVLMA
jgi:hypothetical protein